MHSDAATVSRKGRVSEPNKGLGSCAVPAFRFPDYPQFSARPRGFPESRASFPGARASSPRRARESGATSTVRGHRCPRSKEDRDLVKPTGPG